MALNLTPEQIKQLNIDANSAEPYADDAPELILYDGDERDSARMKATHAKKLLEQDAKEKAERNNNG